MYKRRRETLTITGIIMGTLAIIGALSFANYTYAKETRVEMISWFTGKVSDYSFKRGSAHILMTLLLKSKN